MHFYDFDNERVEVLLKSTNVGDDLNALLHSWELHRNEQLSSKEFMNLEQNT